MVIILGTGYTADSNINRLNYSFGPKEELDFNEELANELEDPTQIEVQLELDFESEFAHLVFD